MAVCLCLGGWFEEYGMMLSVKGGFLYMEAVRLVCILWIVMSRKFIWLLDSGSAVNFMLGWSVLKSSCKFMMSVWRESNIIRMSSIYRKYAEMLCLSRSSVRCVSSSF